MTRRMLINAQRPEELRIATVDDFQLQHFQVEIAERGQTKGNIYRGTVANVQPSLNAAFIDYGADKHGFLSVGDVVREVWHRNPSEKGRPRIDEILERGRSLIVQVTKDAEGQKGAGLTTNVSIAGRYLVLTPYDDTRGVSRKVEDDDVRRKLKEQISDLPIPPGCGVIIRTNAIDQNKTALARDLGSLLRVWKKIGKAGEEGSGKKLLYSDQDLILKALRDYLDASCEEVVIDDDAAFERAAEYLEAFMPRGKTTVVRYDERTPLFSRYKIEEQIETIYGRSVPLASGGSIVIDRTEALIAIDVNSGRSNKGKDQEETAIHTNTEAAQEIARQLRLRDIGGLVVVDFIDMWNQKHQRDLEKALKDAMKADKARSTIGKISRNGLLEINRQKIGQALQLRTQGACPTCTGTGRIASPELISLALLRRIEARVTGGGIRHVRVTLHPEIAEVLQNHRRQEVARIERDFNVEIQIVADPSMHRPDQELEWTEDEAAASPAIRKHAAAVDASHLTRPDDPLTADEPSAAGADAVQPSAGGNGKRKRRRRGRKKGQGQLPHEQQIGPVITASTFTANESEDAQDDEDDEFEELDTSPPALTAGSPPAESPAVDGVPRGKKRRRRRKGRKRPDGELAGSFAGPASSEAPLPDDEESTEDEAEVSPQKGLRFIWVDLPDPTTSPERPERRKKSRRKSSASPAVDHTVESGELPIGDEDVKGGRRTDKPAEAGDAVDGTEVSTATAVPVPKKAAPRRRRSPRRTKPKGDDAGATPGEEPGEGE